MRKSIIIALIALLCLPFAAAAQRTLSGKVTDEATKQPLVGATLYWKNTTAGSTTSADGSYSLKRVSGFETLVVDYLGYDIVEIEVSKDVTTLDIELKPSAVDIDAVIVEGQQRGNFSKSSGITRQEQISFAGLPKPCCGSHQNRCSSWQGSLQISSL